MNPPSPITGDAARQAAQAELRRAEYHRDDPTIVNRVLNWLGARLDSVVSGSPAGSAILILLVLLAAVATFAIIRAGRPRRLARARAAGDVDPLAANHQIDHRRLAADLEAQQRFAEAQREWLRATVATIEARGALDPRPGRTGAGLAREAGAVLPGVAAELNQAIDAFDEVWFGRRPGTAADAAIAHYVADAVRTARLDDTVLAR